MRMKEIERKHDISLRLMPFSVRQIMLDMNNAPFPPSKASKVKYMWRDIERRAAKYGFPATVPAPYPLQEFDRANKIALIIFNLQLNDEIKFLFGFQFYVQTNKDLAKYQGLIFYFLNLKLIDYW